MMNLPAFETIQRMAFYKYHAFTKHTPAKLYSERWYLDWENQPNPFRHYLGAAVIPLPPPQKPTPVEFFHPVPPAPQPWDLQQIAQLLYYSMAISAWKEVKSHGARWSLRVNPSSGNLHPTETHLVTCGVNGLADGVYHFRVDTFALEQRALGDVRGLLKSLHYHTSLSASPVTFLLSSIFWREAWKYRDRAFRYCHHDLGHAMAAVCEALAGLGHTPQYRHRFDDAAIAERFGLTDSDECPGVLIGTSPWEPFDWGSASHTMPQFTGQPNALSEDAIAYSSIEQVYEATRTAIPQPASLPDPPALREGEGVALNRVTHSRDDLWTLIRRRRSGVDFDGQTELDAAELGAILYRATESYPGDVADFRHGEGGNFLVHLFLYVHRVNGIQPGVYYYDRRSHTLFVVEYGDARRAAAGLSLGQAIAADSAFAVSMIADFPRAVSLWGERAYRAVHLEAGAIGQGLYLGAEAVGVQGTGIGAFFDDDVNRFLKLPSGMEVIYHFTVGGAVDDPRIQVCKSYEFEDEPS